VSSPFRSRLGTGPWRPSSNTPANIREMATRSRAKLSPMRDVDKTKMSCGPAVGRRCIRNPLLALSHVLGEEQQLGHLTERNFPLHLRAFDAAYRRRALIGKICNGSNLRVHARIPVRRLLYRLPDGKIGWHAVEACVRALTLRGAFGRCQPRVRGLRFAS
jgi:hypothetical protein